MGTFLFIVGCIVAASGFLRATVTAESAVQQIVQDLRILEGFAGILIAGLGMVIIAMRDNRRDAGNSLVHDKMLPGPQTMSEIAARREQDLNASR